MIRSFSYPLLITCFVLTLSCKTVFVATDINTQNITVSDSIFVIDSQIVRMYLPYKNILEKDMSRVISISEKEMIKGKPESGLTNLLADLLLEEGKLEVIRKNLPIQPQISFLNYGGIRTGLPKGEITVGKIFEIMPFENEMVFIQLSGEQLKQFFDIVAGHGGESVSGVKFVISNDKSKNITIDDEKLVTDRKYWLVTNDYAANGGDGLEILTQNSEMITTGKKIRDIIISNFEQRKQKGDFLVETLDGRIKNE